MKVVKNVNLRGDGMFDKSEKICLGVLACIFTPAIGFVVGVSIFSSSDKVNVKANRYSSCIERQSEIGELAYEEMKEVCSEYLK